MKLPSLKVVCITSVVTFIVTLGLYVADNYTGIMWIGETNLEMRFVVVDADTNIAIPHATIEFLSHELKANPNDPYEFTLITDASGTLVLHRICTTGGTSSGLRFSSTRHVVLPDAVLRVNAEGYQTSEFDNLSTPERRKSVKRIDGKHDLVVVEIKLKQLSR